MSKVAEFADVTRITIVPGVKDSVVYERWEYWEDGVEIHLQDDGRTLKIFPRSANA